MELTTRESPSVVPRSDIPISSAPADAGLEVRPFLAHWLLGPAMSSSSVELAWTRAEAGQSVAPRAHSSPGLLIILGGSATLLGQTARTVQQGDVITLPRDEEYGFAAVGPDGLHALHVAFRDKEAPGSPEVTTLEALLERNEVRTQLILNNPFFLLWREHKIDTERKRTTVRDCLRVFADCFQTFLFTRQAMCRDAEYAALFGQHLLEELGHNVLLPDPKNPRVTTDAVLRATSNWFCHQMLTLDNSGKAVVNLVLETAGYYLGVLAKPVFDGDGSAPYFETHAVGDADHKDLCVRVLEGEHPSTYRRLHRVLEDSWDMLDAMTRRIAALVKADMSS